MNKENLEEESKPLIKAVLTHPISIGVMSTAVIVFLIYIAGQIMRVIAGAVREYKGLKSAINTPAAGLKLG